MRLFSMLIPAAVATLLAAAARAEPVELAVSEVAAAGPVADLGLGEVMLAMVPEPAGLALLAVGAELLFVWRFRAADAPADA